MRIQFIWFNLNCPPGMNVGVSILSRELMEAGHSVDIIHLNEIVGYTYTNSKMLKHIETCAPDMFLLSFGTNHFKMAKEVIKIIKNSFPSKKILCGGVHTTFNPEEIIHLEGVNFICIGEADNGILLKFINSIERNENYKNIKGFWIKENDEIIKNPPAYLPDINNQTMLNFELVDYKKIIQANRGFAETISGRGCQQKCNYCHNSALIKIYKDDINPKTPLIYSRKRDVNNFINELKSFLARYPAEIKAFSFGDDSFITDKKWLYQFLDEYRNRIKLPFVINALYHQIDEEIAEKLSKAGCNMVKFGIESGSERIRKQILRKNFQEDKLKKVIKTLHKYKINARGYIMLGIPTETEKEILTTFKLCSELHLDSVRPSFLYPFPGTDIYEFCRKHNLLKQDADPTTYSDVPKVIFPPSIELFMKKAMWIAPWLLNKYLDDHLDKEYSPLIDEIFKLSEEEWIKEDRKKWIKEKSVKLAEACKKRGMEHYFNPFLDRHDVIFLVSPTKIQKILNLEM